MSRYPLSSLYVLIFFLIPLTEVISAEIILKDKSKLSFIDTPGTIKFHPKIIEILQGNILEFNSKEKRIKMAVPEYLKYEGSRISIALEETLDSSHFPRDIKVYTSKTLSPYISYSDGQGGSVGYRYIGMIDDIFVINYSWSGGGSGTFKYLYFLSVDSSIENEKNLYVAGSLFLGDRYVARITVNDKELYIGKDQGWFSKSGGKGYPWSRTTKRARLYDIKILNKKSNYQRVELSEKIDRIGALRIPLREYLQILRKR